MANVLHKVTLQYRQSVNTPDFMDGNWIINPDPVIISTVPQKYWKVVGDSLLEMDTGEKATADSTELTQYKEFTKLQLSQQMQNILETAFPADVQRSLFQLYQDAKADGLVNRAAYIVRFWNWLKQGIALKHSKNNNIDSALNKAGVDAAAQLNLVAINASIPDVSIRGALAILD